MYPLLRIDAAVYLLHGALYFSFIDLRSCYWQMAVGKVDRQNTAFVAPNGLYEFRVIPFGLRNAPVTFVHWTRGLLQLLK